MDLKRTLVSLQLILSALGIGLIVVMVIGAPWKSVWPIGAAIVVVMACQVLLTRQWRKLHGKPAGFDFWNWRNDK